MKTEKILDQFHMDYQFRLSRKTLKAYLFAVNQLLTFTGKPFDKITKRDIRHWIMQLSDHGYNPLTVRSKLIALKTFYKYCCEEAIMEENPAKTVPFPKIKDTTPRYLTKKDLTQLREVADDLKGRALIEVLFATGVRISELTAIHKKDVSWTDRKIVIQKGKGKKGRVVLFSSFCEVYLKAYLDSRTDDLPYLFVNKLSDKQLHVNEANKIFRYYSEKVGFYVRPHMLRHTFAAHFAQKGMPQPFIQKLLGHDQPRTTEVYTRLYNHARKNMYDDWM